MPRGTTTRPDRREQHGHIGVRQSPPRPSSHPGTKRVACTACSGWPRWAVTDARSAIMARRNTVLVVDEQSHVRGGDPITELRGVAHELATALSAVLVPQNCLPTIRPSQTTPTTS